jgi:hypothetical protein
LLHPSDAARADKEAHMNPLVNRQHAAESGHAPAGDTPMQLPLLSEEAGHALAAGDAGSRYQGDLFLPGWLRIEREPQAEQGPGVA